MSDVGIRLLTTRTPTPMMDASLQFAYGLILRGFVHILHLDRTRPRLAATLLGLCEAVLVHGDVRAPRRSGRAAYDAWEVDAYVGIVARLALDLVTDGPGKAAIVGMWAVLGVVILDLLFRATSSSSSSYDYDDDDSSTIISSIRGRRSSRRHSPVRRSSTRERHGLAPRRSERDRERDREEVRPPPSGRARPDISQWTASLPAAALSMSRASSGSQHPNNHINDPEYDQHARESTVEWQPRTPPATVMATPSTTIRNGISGTEVSVMHLSLEDTETKSTITSESGSAYESAAPSGPSLAQVQAAIANTPVKSGLGSTYESALAPASTVRMLRPRHAIPTPEPSDFSTLSSLQSRRRPVPTNSNTTDSPAQSRRSRMDDDRSELTQDLHPPVANTRRVSRSRSPPTRALLDPALPAASSIPNPASPPRKRTPSPDSSLALRPSGGASRSQPPESVASSDLGSELSPPSRSLSKRPSRASRSHFAPSIPEESEVHDSASEVSIAKDKGKGKEKAVSRKSSRSHIVDAEKEEVKSTISRKTSRSLAGASIPEEPRPAQPEAPVDADEQDVKKPALSRKTSRASRLAEPTPVAAPDPATPPPTAEVLTPKPPLSRKNSHKSTSNNDTHELTPDDLPAPLARRPSSRIRTPSPPPLDPLVPVPESPAPPSSSSVVVTADESLPTNARSPSPTAEGQFDTMRKVRPSGSTRMNSSRSNVSRLTEAYIPPTPLAASSGAPTPTAAVPNPGMVSYPIVAPSPSASPAPAESVSEAALVTAEEETPVPSTAASPAVIARVLSPPAVAIAPVPVASPPPPAQAVAKEEKTKSVKAKSSVSQLQPKAEKAKEKEKEQQAPVEDEEPLANSAREHALEKRPEAQRTKSSKSVKSDVSKRTKASAVTAQPSAPPPAPRSSAASRAAPPPSKAASKPSSKPKPKRRSGGLSSDEEDVGSESGSGSDAIDSGLEEFSLDSPSVASSRSRSDESALEPAPSFGVAGAGLLAKSGKAPSSAAATPNGKTKKRDGKAATEAATPTQEKGSVAQDYFSLRKAETEADRSVNAGAGRGSSRRSAEAWAEGEGTSEEDQGRAKGRGKEKEKEGKVERKQKGRQSDREVTSSDAERKIPAPASLRTVAQRAMSGQPKKSTTTLAHVAAAKRGSPLGRAITAPAKMRHRPKSTGSDATTVLSDLTAPHDRSAVLARAEALRVEANDEEAKGREADAERTKADFEGRFMDALRAKVRRVEHRERSARLHRRAERRYLHAHNMTQDRSQHVIDIHGLKVTEARSQVEKALRDTIVAGAPRLRVITGRGNHSVGNVPILKTRIIEAMAEYHIPTKVHPTNPGELWIELAPGAVGTPS